MSNLTQEALSAAPTTQQTNVLDELEKWASETDGIDPNSYEWVLWNSLITKIQSLKPQP